MGIHPLEELNGIDTNAPPKLRALGPRRLLIVSQKSLTVYDPATRRSTPALNVAQTALGIFGDAATGPDGTILVTSGNGVVFCTGAVRSAGIHCSEYGYRQLGLKLFHDPQVDGRGFLVVGESLDTGDERLIGFDGKAWRTVWQGGRTKLRGWRGVDGELWVQKGGVRPALPARPGTGLKHGFVLAGRDADPGVGHPDMQHLRRGVAGLSRNLDHYFPAGGLDAGMDGYVSKPIHPDRMLEAIAQVTSNNFGDRLLNHQTQVQPVS